jgi:hypothetical protein
MRLVVEHLPGDLAIWAFEPVDQFEPASPEAAPSGRRAGSEDRIGPAPPQAAPSGLRAGSVDVR